MQRLLRILFFGNLWVAGGGVCFTLLVQYTLQGQAMPEYTLLFIFLGIFSIYGAQRLMQTPRYSSHPTGERHQWVLQHKYTLSYAIASALVPAALLAFFIPLRALLLLGIPFVISILYSLPMPEIRGKKSLREIPLLKSFLVALSWTLVCTVFAGYSMDASLFGRPGLYLLSPAVFCYTWALTIPFDIRDIEQDKQDAILTLGHTLGAKRIKRFAQLAMVLCMLLTGCGYLLAYWSLAITAAWYGSCLLGIICIRYTGSENGPYWFDGMLDGCMYSGLLFYLIFRMFL